MKLRHLRFLIPLAVLVVAGLACEFSASTANIASATLSANESGSPATTTFTPEQSVFYLVVELANAPDDTRVKAVWTAVDAEGVDANLQIDESELTSGSGTLTFNLSNSSLWPTGAYEVDLYLNDELERTLEFEVR